jgi:hypothetical protein
MHESSYYCFQIHSVIQNFNTHIRLFGGKITKILNFYGKWVLCFKE